MALSDSTLRRYARHLVLPEIGEEGQKKLLASSVLVIGAGGLGSAALATMASSGVGRLGILEPDRVELSNLQRQMLFEEADIGRPKVEAAHDRLEEINPGCIIELFPERLNNDNAHALIHNFFSFPHLPSPASGGGVANHSPRLRGEEEGGIVLDCSDNFETRFALNDACFHEKKTLISAAISGFSAQLSTFKPYLGTPHPCYRCLVADMPERERNCAQEGIIGPLAGIMGSMQALEAIKELLGIGESLSGHLLVMDALTMNIRKVALPRDPACPICHAAFIAASPSADGDPATSVG